MSEQRRCSGFFDTRLLNNPCTVYSPEEYGRLQCDFYDSTGKTFNAVKSHTVRHINANGKIDYVLFPFARIVDIL